MYPLHLQPLYALFALLQMARLAIFLDPTCSLGEEILKARNMGQGVEPQPADITA